LVTKVLKGSEGRAVGLYRMFFDVGGICDPFVVTVADYYVMVMPFYVITVLMVSNLTFSLWMIKKGNKFFRKPLLPIRHYLLTTVCSD